MKKLIPIGIAILLVFMFLLTLANAANVVVYCHAGLGPPTALMLRDTKTYLRNGFEVWMVTFQDEEGLSYSASDDIYRTKEMAEYLLSLGHTVYLVGVSRGGYVALGAFLRYPHLFKKCVSYIAPICYTNYDAQNLPDDVREKVIEYFAEIPNPLELVEQGGYEYLADRILLFGGGRDRVCPVSLNIVPFAEIVGCEYVVSGFSGHMVSRRMAKRATRWMLLEE